MNERINQLANIWANRRSEDEKLGITYTFSEKALEKFAESIVMECTKILADNSEFKGCVIIVKHFGVKEYPSVT